MLMKGCIDLRDLRMLMKGCHTRFMAPLWMLIKGCIDLRMLMKGC